MMTILFTTVVAQTPAQLPSTPAGFMESSPLMSFAPFIAVFLIFYFLVLRPQNKKIKNQQKEHAEMIESLEKGDQVLTVSGIYGTVESVIDDKTLEIEISEGVVIRILKDKIGEKSKLETKIPALKAKNSQGFS